MFLVVDDEPRQRRFITNTIRELRPDSPVLEARNGRDAMQVIATQPVKAVVTDIHMPMLDGLAFISECRKAREDILVVFLTAHANFEYAQKALQLGALDYIVKPANAGKLREMLDKIDQRLNQNRMEQAERAQLEDTVSQTFPVYLEALLRRFVRGESSEGELGELEDILGRFDRHAVLVMERYLGPGEPIEEESLREILTSMVP